MALLSMEQNKQVLKALMAENEREMEMEREFKGKTVVEIKEHEKRLKKQRDKANIRIQELFR